MVSGVVLSFCFSLYSLFRGGLYVFIWAFLAALFTVGVGFLVHEVCHKLTAQRFGLMAMYKMWEVGLILALALSLATMGRFVFAAPGAVLISAPAYWYEVIPTQRQRGLIALSGPLSNLGLSLVFASLVLFAPIDSFLSLVGRMGFVVNLWLAAFNLIPIPPMDGHKVFSWNILLWVLVAFAAWGPLVLYLQGVVAL